MGKAVMPKLGLTDKFVAGVKPGSVQTTTSTPSARAWCFALPGTGCRAWCAFYTSPRDGKRARVTLGRYPQTSLADARRMALEAKALVEEGIDPRDVATGAMTVRHSSTPICEARSPEPPQRQGRRAASQQEHASRHRRAGALGTCTSAISTACSTPSWTGLPGRGGARVPRHAGAVPLGRGARRP